MRFIVSALICLVFAQTGLCENQKEPNNLKPFFSDEYVNAIISNAPYPLVYSEEVVGGVNIPLINGKGLWGVCIRNGAGKPMEQAEYEAAWLHAQGVTHVRSSAYLGEPNELNQIARKMAPGVPIEHFKEFFKCLEKYGISFAVNQAGVRTRDMAGFIPRERLAKIEEQIKNYDGSKSYIPGSGATGNIYNPDFLQAVIDWEKALSQTLADNKAFRTIQPSNETAGVPTFDKWGKESFVQFAKDIFNDETPALDTNKDGATFNKAYDCNYTDWQQLEVFAAVDMTKLAWDQPNLFQMDEATANFARTQFAKVWVAKQWANYQQSVAKAVTNIRPDIFVCESSNGSTEGGGQDLATLASQPSIRGLFRNTYMDPTFSMVAAAISHAYGKPLFLTEFNTQHNDTPEAIYNYIAETLPYASAYEWFTMSYIDGSGPGDWSWHNTIDWWGQKGNWLGKPYTEWPTGNNLTIYKPAVFDARWEAFPKFAPFISKFFSSPNEQNSGILWVLGGTNFPAARRLIFEAHATTEQAILLRPDAIDFKKYKLVIYFTPYGDHIMSSELFKKFTDFMNGGGTVIACAHEAAKGQDIRGISNKQYFLKGLVPATQNKIVASYGTDGIGWLSSLNPYLAKQSQKSRVNKFQVKAEPEPIVWKFPLPEESKLVLIEDMLQPWDQYGKIQAWYSADNQNWIEMPCPSKHFALNYQTRKLLVTKDLHNSKFLYLKYLITRQEKAPDYPGKNIYYLSPFGNLSTSLRGLTITVTNTINYGIKNEISDGNTAMSSFGALCLYQTDGSVDYNTFGTIKTSDNKNFPLIFQHNQGKGKLVLINDPEVFKFFRNGAVLPFEQWTKRFDLLNHIAHKTADVNLPNINGLHIYKGKDCLLANYLMDDYFFTPEAVYPWVVEKDKYKKAIDMQIQCDAPSDKVVVFDAFEQKLVNGPYIECPSNKLTFIAKFFYPKSFHIWVVKPYGTPVCLYADGTLRKTASIDSGFFDPSAKTLTVDLTDYAYISTPFPPKKIMSGGKELKFNFDNNENLLKVYGNQLPQITVIQF